MEEINKLKKNIVLVYDQINACQREVVVIPELKREKVRLQTELNRLEIKTRSLIDDCEVKVNIHI